MREKIHEDHQSVPLVLHTAGSFGKRLGSDILDMRVNREFFPIVKSTVRNQRCAVGDIWVERRDGK